jgi:hypothetical protein
LLRSVHNRAAFWIVVLGERMTLLWRVGRILYSDLDLSGLIRRIAYPYHPHGNSRYTCPS